MAKIILFLILGLLLGVGLAVVIHTYRPPPGRRPPRPNVMKRDKWRQVLITAGAAAGVILLIAMGYSLFFGRGEPEPQVTNTISQKVEDVSEMETENPDADPEDGSSGISRGGRSLLIVDSPIAKAALKASPVASYVDRFGIGQDLGEAFHLPRTATRTEPQPTGTPSSEGESVNVLPAPPIPSAPKSNPKPVPTSKPAAKPEPKPATSGTGLKFTVHLASFEIETNAERTLAKLKAAGVPAFMTRIEVKGRTYHRLMAGRFPSAAEAEAYGRELTRRGLTKDTGGFVVKPLFVGQAR